MCVRPLKSVRGGSRRSRVSARTVVDTSQAARQEVNSRGGEVRSWRFYRECAELSGKDSKDVGQMTHGESSQAARGQGRDTGRGTAARQGWLRSVTDLLQWTPWPLEALFPSIVSPPLSSAPPPSLLHLIEKVQTTHTDIKSSSVYPSRRTDHCYHLF